MLDFTRVIIAGRLTRDPETRFAPSGLAVANFGVAVKNRSRSGGDAKEDVSFFDVVVFGKQGEKCAEYLSKGRPVLVEGRLRQRRWESDGVKRSKVEILADNVQFLGSPRGGSAEGAPGAEPPTEPQDDDIPF